MATTEDPREIDQLAQAWEDRVQAVLGGLVGKRAGAALARRWAGRLPTTYRAGVAPEAAARDIVALDRLGDDDAQDLVVAAKEETTPDGERLTRIAFVRRGPRVRLARAMPILADLGLHVVEERTARLHGPDEVWLQDFGVLGPDGAPLDLDRVGARVTACIDAVWSGRAESDSLNRLVVLTSMGHERLEPLRAYRRYRQRLGSRFTEGYQNDVIVAHPEITERLVRLFELRFGAPEATDGTGPSAPRDEAAEEALRDEILAALDDVPSLDHDRILRNQLGAIEATYRTNAYRPGRGALALKLRSAEVPAMPQPTPLWETYVHGTDVEGVHLRGGMIARGGLRWSDRMDYRTEVLGLMRAQMVKNALIVPAGAKGGFLLRGEAAQAEGDAQRAAVRDAYVTFVSALLDLADDLGEDGAEHPDGVRILDGDDTYLVVAADKGTATFSDTANEIAVGRGYWLGDAFASGGSHGYDHKELGITARGAWVSVERHFGELGIDPNADPITAVGIGDMSGDVFGNGMLLSKSLRLVAAYDHRHVFVDPDPQDPEASWAERRRLFAGVDGRASTWDDYDRDLISAGGGVFPRTAKHVDVTAPMRQALGVDAKRLSPAELIQAILRAPVDLLWNGGIGTVVKAHDERDADAEDRASDAIRVDARDLRCRVVGEGGNLGLTRRARVEYARAGGRVNADFIDNSAGVDSSDHEVNLKVLLDLAVRRGRLDPDERNAVLREVTDDVVAHVLADSFAQARVITQEERRAPRRTQAAEELMQALEEQGVLHRADHGLPTPDELAERRSDGHGLTRPEIAVLVALAKDGVARALLEQDDLDDPAYDDDLAAYFPPAVVERFGDLLPDHPLRRHLIATHAASEVVDTIGPTFVARRAAEFGASTSDVVRAYRTAVGAADARELWQRVDDLERVDTDVTWGLRAEVDEQVRVTSRWFLTHARGADIAATVELHRAGAIEIRERLAELLDDAGRRERTQELVDRGVPADLADRITAGSALLLAPHVVAAARAIDRSVTDVAGAVLHAGEQLSLDGLHRAVERLATPDRMTRWSVQALRDDLLDVRADLARCALREAPDDDPEAAVARFLEERPEDVARLRTFLRELSGDDEGPSAAYPACQLAVRQLQAMVAD
ncbi:NAD-glutamate dehydrogenase domain-containing protein [Patulibacter sp. SYSU D01012]|uniref:NAD-glutamate dehydrogenase domain-containing protein n=1 Tax=Patulibacter sp. SYSU D01012 TaxID=2817381 RepID=UPI001B31519D|nr:NAD-glutamate dehydrogenase domain-containing protein [Patulibacter sp. SYSU D01012]